MIITGDDDHGISDLQAYLNQQFEMKSLGPLRYFLGLEVSDSPDGLFLSQAKYASDLLARAGLTDYIAHAVHIVSQFMAAPRTSHHSAVLHILRYVKGTLLHGLQFSSNSSLTLSGYSDADWAGDPTDRRSTTGFCFFVDDSLIYWRSKKQTLVSRSSAESEYRALADSTSELLWLRRLLTDLGAPQPSSTALHCDSQSAMKMTHNDTFHERTKHIELECHFIRQHVVNGVAHLIPVSSEDQTADIFTKSLLPGRFRLLLDKLKLVSTALS
ncbi:uncharacterized mitochondrial protein AtMg00810-like [Andrographis paniculata]|uniref:uncharacterized mitochondrial protein AtMg00810-like n=1 Tax=Andrographis paniculata TaxID=175694 RepID=UPI0021E8516C|nr:uncharacterized mitochondrial protein AtMg00810-like [Andrographis paniculata]